MNKNLTVNKTLTIIFAMIATVLMAGMAAGFELVNPESKTYTSTSIPLTIINNGTLDTIAYSLDGGNSSVVCSACSIFNSTIIVAAGNHTITAYGYLGNETFTDDIVFMIDLYEANVTDFSLTINTPQNTSYNHSNTFFKVTSNATLDTIKYQIDNNSMTVGCNNCSNYNNTLSLSEGTHTINFEGMLGNITKTANVSFQINTTAPQVNNTTNNTNNTNTTNVTTNKSFSLNIVYPESKTYNTTMIPIKVASNMTLDNIQITIPGKYSYTCYNCSGYNATLNLSKGYYTIKVSGTLGNVTLNTSRMFQVKVDGYKYNYTHNYTYNGTKYDKGFEKLPQLVKSGQISDAELANIIRNNRLNPGVLNRLIKTGMLGEESIDAILDTQFAPPGILRKILKSIGLKEKNFATLICEEYNLTKGSKHKIILDNGISIECKDKIEKDLEDDVEKHSYKYSDDDDEDEKKTVKIGKQKERQYDEDEDEDDSDNKWDKSKGNSEKIPPGLAKKYNGKSNGKGKGKNR